VRERSLLKVTICAVLVAMTWAVFGQTLGHDFVNYDDKIYVYANSLVSAGLSGSSLAEAFVDVRTTNWHPLTTMSHMLDCQLFHLKPAGHHFTNVLLHSVAAILLFVWLSGVTGSVWRSAFVAAVFAIHPLHVESVAWIAERKDVLSAVFFFLTLLAYARYAKARSVSRYLAVSILFACGLMSKPMLVTTPVILLLLDYWPLRRWTDSKSLRGLVNEKLPLLALSIASSIVTYLLQENSMSSIPQLPFVWRVECAVVSYVIYVAQFFWPTGLAVFYPHPEDSLAWWQVALAAAPLICVTWIVYVLRRSRPYLLVGWLWYVLMLLPVIGIVEVGLQGHADRYTYLPHIGIFVALTWLVADLAISIRLRKQVLGAASAVVLVTFGACSWKQTTYWRNSATLWMHTLAVTKNNDVALTNFADWLAERGQLGEALSYFQRGLAVRSQRSGHEHYNLTLAAIHSSIGTVLVRKDRVEEAVGHFQRAIELQPNYPDAHYNLGVVLGRRNDVDGAIAQFRTLLKMSPNDSASNAALAYTLEHKGLFGEAVAHYEIVLKSDPNSVFALNNLSWLLSTNPDASVRNGPRAVELALRSNRIANQTSPAILRTLAAAYAEAGQFENAVEAARAGADLAYVQGDHSFAARLEREADLYRQHRPLHNRETASE
jgi:Tfp pilus assembly protein PilF